MTITNKMNELHDRISVVSNGIAEVDKSCSKVHAQMEPIRARISDLNELVKSRDWALTAHRPKGCTEPTNVAIEIRRRALEEKGQLARELSGLQRQITPLNRELAEMRNDLHFLTQLAVTPESVQDQIDAANAVLAELGGERRALANALCKAQERCDEIAKIESEEVAAAARLVETQAESFLASSHEKAITRHAVADAEKELKRCINNACEARAARPSVLAEVANMRENLSSMDDRISQHTAKRDATQSQLWKLEAHAAWDELIPHIRRVLRKVLHADRTAGRELVEALMREGLREFDEKRRLIRPSWLDSSAAGLDHI